MQAVFPLVASASTLLGGGAAAGAAASAVTLSQAASVLGTVSTAFGVVQGIQQANYQAKVAENNAKLLEDNANRERYIGQIDQQDAGLRALEELSALTTAQAASGFALSSPSLRRMREKNRFLAQRDAERIRYNSEVSATNMENEAAALRAESQVNNAALIAGGALDIGSSLITGASLVNTTKAKSLNRMAGNI